MNYQTGACKSPGDLSHFCLNVQQSYKKHPAKFWENYWALELHIHARLPLHSQQLWLEWPFSSQKCLTSKMNKLQLIPCLAYGMLSLLLPLSALSWIRSWENFISRAEAAPNHPGMPQQHSRPQRCWEEVGTFHCLAQGAAFELQPSPSSVFKDLLASLYFWRSFIWKKPDSASLMFLHHSWLPYPLVTPRQKCKWMQEQKSFHTVTSHKYVPHTQVGLLWRHHRLLSQMFPEARSCRSLQYPLRSGFFLFLPQKALCVCLDGVSVQKNSLSGWLKFQYELTKNWLLVYLKPWQPWHFIRFLLQA